MTGITTSNPGQKNWRDIIVVIYAKRTNKQTTTKQNNKKQNKTKNKQTNKTVVGDNGTPPLVISANPLRPIGCAMVGAFFDLVTLVGLPYFWGHWKIVAQHNCFSYRNFFKICVNAYQKWFKNGRVGPYDVVQISPAWGTNIILRNVWKDFRLSVSVLAMVTRKSFNSKFAGKNRSGILYYHCRCWHRKSKVSPYIIW